MLKAVKVTIFIITHLSNKSSVPDLYLSFYPLLTWKLVSTLIFHHLKEFSAIKTQASNINFPEYFVKG